MKISWLVLPVTLLFLITFQNSNAQQVVLDSLIDIALKNNPEIKASESMSKSFAYKSHASGSLPDPSINVGLLNLPVNSFAFDETPMSGINIGISQKIPWLGKLSNERKLADINTQISETQTNILKNQIIKNVTDAYAEYSFFALSIPIIEDFLDLLEATRNTSEIKYANGDAPAQDMLRISSLYSRVKVKLLNIKQNKYKSLVKLRQLANDFLLPENLTPTLAEPYEDTESLITIDKSPYLYKSSLGVEFSKYNKKISHNNYYPDFVLGVDYRLREHVTGDPVKGADFLSFKVGFTLPLWFNKKQDNKLRAANQMIISSKEQENSVRNLLLARSTELESQLDTEMKSIREYDNSIIPEANAAAESAEIAYEVGQVDFNALLAAQKELFEIKIERLNLLKQYHQSKAALTEVAGTSYERE
ncbi:MAG: TolC family protein [Calditrichaeota bacterium]|nr:MAG: TolC family protein [Calditrichota bacterium]